MRARAIYCALSFGIRPSWMYESSPHYAPMTYRRHLRMNLGYAWRWATHRETAEDIAFEREVNDGAAPSPAGTVHVHIAIDGKEVANAVADATLRR